MRRLLNQDIIHHIKSKGKEKDDPSLIIFQQGKPVDFFVLILEGRVEVTVGKENLLFESGPFTYFGTQALLQNIVLGIYCVLFIKRGQYNLIIYHQILQIKHNKLKDPCNH